MLAGWADTREGRCGGGGVRRSRARSALSCLLKARGGRLDATVQFGSCPRDPVAVARR